VAWWAFGAPVALAPVIASLRPPALAPRDDPRRLRILNLAVVAALALVTLVAQPLWRSGDELTGPPGLLRDAPAGLAQALAGLAGRLTGQWCRSRGRPGSSGRRPGSS
jgi:hypothetical protein